MKEVTGKLLEKAERSIHAAERLLRDGDADFAVARAYYAMFYAAKALLEERGLRFRKHAGVHGAFGEHFAKTGQLDPKYHRWLLDSFNQRVTADYGPEATATDEEATTMIEQAREFLPAVRAHLGNAP